MWHRSVLGALAIAAGVAAGLLVKVLTDKNNKKDDETDDEEVHFIRIEDGEEKRSELSERSVEVQEVCGVYPYLDADFVEGLLAKNSEFNEQYPEETLITVSHKVKFADPENRRTYMEIMLAAGYACDDEGEELTASKTFFTEEGAIISDILNVANQTLALKGEYLEYVISR